MVTLKEIATEAGVSVSTASYVLSRKRPPTKETHKRVADIARRLGYQPNVNAVSLVTGRSYSLGLWVPHPSAYIFSEPYLLGVITGIADSSTTLGYTITLIMTSPQTDSLAALERVVFGRSVDGVLMLRGRMPPALRERIASCGIPVVRVGERSRELHSVCVDDAGGVEKAVDHLVSLNHTRIASISGILNDEDENVRGSSFIKAVRDRGLSYCALEVGDYTQRSGYELMKRLLERSDRPTAVFAANDLMAIGALDACRELGVSVPEEISIVGFDDIDAAAQCSVPLTTVRQPIYDLGVSAVKALIGLVEGTDRPSAPELVCLGTELVVRNSTARASS